MTLDVPTLIVVITFISATASGLMLFTWLQNRAVTALLWWSAAYLTAAIGAALLGARGLIPDLLSIAIANSLTAATAGLMWCGFRNFDGHPVKAWYAAGGSLVWLGGCCIPAFYDSLAARITLASAIYFVYAGLAIVQLWRSRSDGLLSRWLALGMVALHASVYLIRIPLAWIGPLPSEDAVFTLKWLPFVIFETLFFGFGVAFVLLSMTKERAEARHKRAAFIDPLTGVPNRRGLVDRARGVVERCRFHHRPITLLLFDLDHFKRINDTFGHQAGDDILVAFCRAAQCRLGPDDIFARIGGEEFACLLPSVPAQSAFALAERIRSDFDAARFATRGGRLHATVSVGMAHSADSDEDLADLFGAADRALYQAKAKGRNRVEGRRPSLTVVAGGIQVPQGAA